MAVTGTKRLLGHYMYTEYAGLSIPVDSAVALCIREKRKCWSQFSSVVPSLTASSARTTIGVESKPFG